MNAIKPALGVNIRDYDALQLLDGKIWRVSEKIDGVRKLFYKSPTNRVSAYSRTGKPDTWLTHITKWLEQPYFPNNMIYDCELVDCETYFGSEDSFIVRMETISKASQQYEENKADLIAICFDMFRPDGDMTSGFDRTKLLEDTFRGASLDEPIAMVHIYGYIHGANEHLLNSLMSIVEARKGEGLMLLSMDSPYIPGRSKELVKVKRLEEFVGTVIAYEMAGEGTKIEGGISALICEVPGCTVPVRVGVGFSNELRRDLANDSVVGTKIEIEAFSKTKDKTGNISLSMPVFKQFAGV